MSRAGMRPARLTAVVTLDVAGRVRHVVCREPWTGLERLRAVVGTTREGMETRLQAAQARFGARPTRT